MSNGPVPASSRRRILARLHPLLFAAYPILYMWSGNSQEGNSGDALALLVASLLVTTAGVEGLRRTVFRNVEKAAAAMTLAIIVFFNYGSLYDSIHAAGLAVGKHRFLLPLSCLALFALWVWLYRRRGGGDQLSLYFACLGAAFVLLAAGRFFVDTARANTHVPRLDPAWTDAFVQPPGLLPDIYYLVLDGYTRQDQLEQIFEFDNSAFLTALAQRGFSVASQSRANYGYTAASLASSLNFGYFDESLGLGPKSGVEDRVLRELLRNNRSFRLLGRAGYSRHVIDRRVDFSPSEDPPEVLIDCGSSGEFVEAFLQTTAARIGRNQWGGFTAGRRREVILCQFEALQSAISAPGPKFVFFHSLVTHPPFLFERDGSPRRVRDVVARKWRPWLPRESYVDQIVLANRFVLGAIDDILKVSEDAIIVLQGDHGSVTSLEPPNHLSPPDQLEQRFAILNALRIPAAREGAVSMSLSPVNTFPVILREQFGVPVPIREDASFVRLEGDDGGFQKIDFLTASRSTRP